MMLQTVISLALFVFATGEVGTNMDQDNGNWAFHWYVGEPFKMMCNTSSINVQPMEMIVWETPNHGLLNHTVDNDHFMVEDQDNVKNFVLTVKKVDPMFSGVYTCHVYDSNMAFRDKTTFGLNIHGARYKDTSDKYNYNIKVAFIATAVFLVPALTICFVFHFRYLTDEDKMRRNQKKEAKRNFAYAMDNGIKEKDSGLPNGSDKEAFENRGFDTQL